MNACERYEADLSALLDGELDPAKEEELRAHMAGCAECTALYETFSLLHEDAQEPPADLAARIMSAVRSEAEAAAAPAPDNITPMPKRKKHWAGWAAAAACFVIILGAVTIPQLLDQRPEHVGTQVRSIPHSEAEPDEDSQAAAGSESADTAVPDANGTDVSGTHAETPAGTEEPDAAETPNLSDVRQPLALTDAEQIEAVRALLASPAESEMPGEEDMPVVMLSDAGAWTAIWIDGEDLVFTENGTQYYRCTDAADQLVDFLSQHS